MTTKPARSPHLTAEERAVYDRIRTRIHRAERDAKKLAPGRARERAEARVAKNVAARDAFVLGTGIPAMYPAPPQRIESTTRSPWHGKDGSRGTHEIVVEMVLDHVDIGGPQYRTVRVIRDLGGPPTNPRSPHGAMGVAWCYIDESIASGRMRPLCGYRPGNMPVPPDLRRELGLVAAPRTRVVSDRDLYITDNGRIVCGKHCGHTAAYTGRDLSGQPIQLVNAVTARQWFAEVGAPIHCEDCGTFDHPLTNEDGADGIMMATAGAAS